MLKNFKEQRHFIPLTHVTYQPTMEICQSDYPLDWYQQEFIPYAAEYQALPDRKLATILPWMKRYIEPAQKYFGNQLLLLAHYYMGGEIVNIIKYFGGEVEDSYQLALKAVRNPEKKIIVESAVHFMAESISILANEDQQVYITNPKSGCTMEMHAKDYMVAPALEELNQRYGSANMLPVCYMNTSGRIKAMTGEQGGAVCTSSNVKKIAQWALAQNKKVIFIPDQFMGENVASWLNIPKEKIAYWPAGDEGLQFSLVNQSREILKKFDEAQLILFSSHCAVHSYMRASMVHYWRARGYSVIVHPECRNEVVSIADAYGSTAMIWDYVSQDKAGTKKYAIGTENHMVQNVRRALEPEGFQIVNLGDAPLTEFKGIGCGCATMSRNDPPHLVGLLDLLRKGKAPEINLVRPGDVVNEFTGQQTRLDAEGQAWIIKYAKIALENMIRITES